MRRQHMIGKGVKPRRSQPNPVAEARKGTPTAIAHGEEGQGEAQACKLRVCLKGFMRSF